MVREHRKFGTPLALNSAAVTFAAALCQSGIAGGGQYYAETKWGVECIGLTMYGISPYTTGISTAGFIAPSNYGMPCLHIRHVPWC